VDAAIPHQARPSEPNLVTVSGGVACWTPGSPLSAREVLEEADQALYDAKTEGRNRISAAPLGGGGSIQAIDALGGGPDDERALEVSGSGSSAHP